MNSIQENEMYITSNYCKDFLKELTSFLVEKNRAFENTLQKTESKIQFEQKDISFLKRQAEECQQNIEANKKRLSEIPEEIETKNNDIAFCEICINQTEMPVYREYYDSDYGCYTRKDYEATARNAEYIDSKREEIETLESEISDLNRESEKCESNVSILGEMLGNINGCIKQKEDLVSRLKEDVSFIKERFSGFKNSINSLQCEIEALNKKIVNCANFIHAYGTTMASIQYRDLKLQYNANQVFTITSNDLNQEIAAFNTYHNSTLTTIGFASKSTMTCLNDLTDEVSKSLSEKTTKHLVLLKKINDTYKQNETLMRKALTFLVSYENIKI